MLIDLHLHSNHTRGCALTVRDVVRRGKEVGLDGVVFTDINTLEGASEIEAAAREENFLALCGTELVTDKGHYLCYFAKPSEVSSPPQALGTPPFPVRDAMKWALDRGAAIVAAHPYERAIERPSADFIFTLEGLHGIETQNAQKKPSQNDAATEAADHLALPGIGSSGAPATLAEIGRAATLFRDMVTDAAGLVAQLRAGTVYPVMIGVEPRPDAQRREPRGGPRRAGGFRSRDGSPGGSSPERGR